jgi:biotin carboxylase
MDKNIYKKSVLLCDASFSAIPLLETLQAKGFYVAVCGSRPEDPCHALADKSYTFDYANIKKLLKIVKDNNFDYLVPGCTDISYTSCAWVAMKLGLPGYDNEHAVRVINHKDEYRKLGKDQSYPIPAYETQSNNFKDLNFPTLLKPVSSYSGRGILRFEKYSQLRKFLDSGTSLLPQDQFLLEEFVSGQLYSHSAFLEAGKIKIDFFVNEYCTVYPFQVNSSHLSTKLTLQVRNKMRSWLKRFAKHLNLVDGLLHTQFISDGVGVYLIESCRRCPGDLYSLLIQKSTGINYAALYVSPFINSPYGDIIRSAQKYYSRHTLSINRDAIFLSAAMKIPNLNISYVPLKKTGELLRAAPLDRAGIFFIEHADALMMQDLTRNLYKFAKLETLQMMNES